MEYDRLDKLINDLARPIYVYRMAAGMNYYPENSPLLKSAQTRRKNARREIAELVAQYVKDAGMLSPSEKDFVEWLGVASEG